MTEQSPWRRIPCQIVLLTAFNLAVAAGILVHWSAAGGGGASLAGEAGVSAD